MPRSCERRHLPDFGVVEALPCFAASSFAEDENKEERGDKGDTGKEGKGSSCLKRKDWKATKMKSPRNISAIVSMSQAWGMRSPFLWKPEIKCRMI